MDDMTSEQRHQNMVRICSINTKPEETVRKYLFANGFRYRKNDKRYPGKPDIVLPKYHTILFVHGCFWHQHSGCKYAAVPKSNIDYWVPKLQRNTCRDSDVISELRKAGWKIIVVWECALKGKNREFALQKMRDAILSDSMSLVEISQLA